MAAGIFGLVGAAVGGLVAIASNLLFDWYRARREAKVAERVVRSELREAAEAIKDALKGSKWPPGWQYKRWSESWTTNRRALAATVSDSDFDQFARAYLYMDQLQSGLAAGQRPLSEEDRTFMNNVKSYLEAHPHLAGDR